MPQTVSNPVGRASETADTTEKKQRWRSGSRNNRWRWRKKPKAPPLPEAPPLLPREEEDWEKDVRNVTPPDHRQGLYGLDPYGPEDVVCFALRGMSLEQTQTHCPHLTDNYSPARHHLRPVNWTQHINCIVADQFADAEE